MPVLTPLDEASVFLDQQLAIPTEDLAVDQRKCYICHGRIGKKDPETGQVECAIRLSACGHIFGSNCLETWVSQPHGESNSNTCPICRAVLFEREREVSVPDIIGLLDREAERVRNLASEDTQMELTATGRSRVNTFEEGPPNEVTDPTRIALLRRLGASRDVILYDRLVTTQTQDGRRNALYPRQNCSLEILTAQEDHSLFCELEARGAFQVPGMNIGRASGDANGRTHQPQWSSNTEAYETLRNQGVRWDHLRNGWFRFGWRVVFNGVEAPRSEEERYFEYLQRQGAFHIVEVEILFRLPLPIVFDIPRLSNDSNDDSEGVLAFARTDWQIYQQILKYWVDSVAWNEECRAWLTADGRSIFDDIARVHTTIREVFHGLVSSLNSA